MKLLYITLAASTLAYGQADAKSGSTIDCGKLYKQAVKEISQLKKSEADVLKTVRTYAQRYPSCLCEVVKASIIGSEANKSLVKNIVETAIVAAPDQLDAIVNCSIAIAPDAATEIAEVANQFTDGAATVSKKSNLMYLSGKNSYSGGKNGGGKNGYGKNGGAANEAPASEPLNMGGLDNLGSGTLNTNFQPNEGGVGLPGGTDGPITANPTDFDPSSAFVVDEDTSLNDILNGNTDLSELEELAKDPAPTTGPGSETVTEFVEGGFDTPLTPSQP